MSEREQINEKILSLTIKLEQVSGDSRYYEDALIKLLIPKDFSLTLVYKNQRNIPYIKGRIYWDNKQREVQIGSIPNVISQINYRCKNGLIPPVKGLGKKNITWEDIRGNPEIESAVKYIGKIKFRQYLLKHFKFPKKSDPSDHLFQVDSTNTKGAGTTNADEYPQNSLESNDWYSLWRRDNL